MAKKSKIHILSVCTSDSTGGAARAAYRIHTGVRATGVESRMLVKDKKTDDPDVHSIIEFVPNNAVYRIGDWCASKVKNKIQHYFWNKYPNKDKNYKSDLRGMHLHGALQKLPFDVLHLHWMNQRFISIDDLLKVNKPIVWTLHDSWSFCGVCHYFLDCEGYKNKCGCCPQLGSSDSYDLSHKVWQHKANIYRELDLHIVSPSRWLADCARNSSLFQGVDIRVIPNCIDTDVYRPLSKQEILSVAECSQNAVISRILRQAIREKRVAKPFMLYGAVNAATDRIKGFASLLSALQILDEKGFEAELVVFGADETELPLHFRNISVTFVGYISDTSTLTALYSAADLMLVPSLTENLSCAIMEAMSCATPVVAFNIGGNSDMVEHQVNGYLASESDCADLASGIEWCINNNNDNQLGIVTRQKIMTCFTSEIVSGQYIDLYKYLT